jgi:hypothetical protein
MLPFCGAATVRGATARLLLILACTIEFVGKSVGGVLDSLEIGFRRVKTPH